MDALQALSLSGREITLPHEDIEAFRMSLRGELVEASHPHYNEYRSIWNGMINRKPALIARCVGAADVIEAVRFARRNDLYVSIRGGGHHVSGNSVCDGGMVIDLSAMNSVYVDPHKSTARVQAGAKLIDIDHETQAYGLVTPLGVVSDTGVAGLTLHGGMGWLMRRYGLSLDNILSLDVVTADGKLVRASQDENPDLFWAIRGGGGNFGVVTSFEFKLYPISSQVWFLLAIYPPEVATKGLAYMRDNMPKMPDELSLISVFWNAPDAEFIPEEYRGQPIFVMAGCYSGPLEKGEKVIAPFRNLGKPVADLSGPMPFHEIQKILDVNFPNGRQYYWKSAYLNELNDEAIKMLVNYAKNRPSPFTTLNVWALGGQISKIDPASTAFYQRNWPYLISMESSWDNPEDSEKNVSWTRKVYADVNSKLDAGLYLNFPGFVEEGEDLMAKTFGPNYKRLKDIKSKYDPENFFCGALNIKPNGSK
jgi:FAD/FMN-containing dehydrogenase